MPPNDATMMPKLLYSIYELCILMVLKDISTAFIM